MAGSSNALDVSSLREDLKYMAASNVNVSNFVSVKLCGRSNYDIWKAQMLCLIESQVLLHIINAEHHFPVDKGVHMILQYDKLVKGWILGSVNEKLLLNLVKESLNSAQKLWMELESLYTTPISDTPEGDSSNAARDVPAIDVIEPVVSAISEELKYMQASNVNISNFVSVKLSSRMNYITWKAQMLCLVKSQALLHIIDAENHFPGDKGVHMIAQYDQLVKGWIFGSMSDHVLIDFVDYDSAREVWMELESRFGQPICVAEGDSSNTLDVFARKEDMKYMLASTVNVSNFVTVELSGQRNYDVWKTQMLCLIESHNLLFLIHSRVDYRGFPMIKKFDELVNGWILGTMNDQVLGRLIICSVVIPPVHDVWRYLGSIITSLHETSYGEGDPWDALYVYAPTQELKYMKASNVNISNFVSVKLSGHNNYKIWKVQMLNLIKSQALLHLIYDNNNLASENKYNILVKGWIFGTMKEELLKDFTDYVQAKTLWLKLESTFNPGSDTKDEGVTGFIFRREVARVPEIKDMDNIKLKKELYEAAVEGCWWKTKSMLKVHKNAATKAITENGHTILHLAVEMGHNYFLEKLLEFLEDGKDIETQNSMGQTALHVAAIVGNTQAAKLLVQKRENLLIIEDDNNDSPLDSAICNMNVNTYVYMSKTALQNPSLSHDHEEAVAVAIVSKQYDLAVTLLKRDPQLVIGPSLLMLITITFPTNLGFTESFIYPSFNDVRQKTVVRGSLLFHSNFLEKCVDDTLQAVKIFSNTCFSWLGKSSMTLLVPIATLYQLICLIILVLRLPFSMFYFHLWKVLAVTVRPIKNIQKKEKDYQQAKEILSLICDQMGTSNDNYSEAIFEAVRLGAYEVVDEILFKSPKTINYKNEEKLNVIQLAIINRSEKVYNLIYHIIERTRSYRRMTDSFENNLVHLAGRLAPSSVLGRTTGAALQLQRELLWFQEVEKLLLPLELRDKNNDQETPAMVFTREHQDLMKQGESWMKTTAESCSITAALIVTVVFAAAITVPGGSNQESGIPLFKKEFAFTVFALSNAFSLFTATTALLLFLSILTARFSEKDFLVSLPRRLILGLLTLFLSTTSMMVAFGAILFLVFCDQRPWMLAPIFAFACLPISVIVTIKLPLLADLIQSTYVPIFGKQSYLESCKVNRKNTIFC